MDGHFVPNLMFGPKHVKEMRKLTDICPLEIHLMVDEPMCWLKQFEIQSQDIIQIHYESKPQELMRNIMEIKKLNKVYVVLSPPTPVNFLEEVAPYIDGILIMGVNPGFEGQQLMPNTLQKITKARHLLGDDKDIEVDGHVSPENIREMERAGANVFVGGSSLLWRRGEPFDENLAKWK
jgi:ribulose-phosphate 3-epimerase